MRIASAGIEELQKHVDTLLIIPNQNLFSIANERTTFHEAFAMADQVLHSGVRGITDLMVMPGLINLDFADVRTVMSEMGKAMMGTGEAEGDKRAIEAAEAAISNPLLDEVSMKGARGVLINITGSMDMTLFEVDEAANRIRAEVDPDANIIVGSTFNQDLEGKVRVSVVATGIDIQEDESRPTVRINTGATTKPWRQPLVVNAPTEAAATPAPDIAKPAATPTPTPVEQTPSPAAAAAEQSPVPEAPANPVGDVHERIRRMLTEGAAGDLAAKPPYRSHQAAAEAAPQPAAPVRRAEEVKPALNPFRGAQNLGKNSFEAAFDIFKSIGGGGRDDRPEEPAARASDTRAVGNGEAGAAGPRRPL